MVSDNRLGESGGKAPIIKNELFLYTIMVFSQALTVMNTSMFNVALPVISNHFQISAHQASVIVSSYSIVFALSAILYSKLSSSIPIKWLLTIGVFIFSIGSIVGMTAISYPILIAGRVVQAVGSSAITALNVIITTRYIPLQRRGKRLGMVGAGVTLGFGLGPVVGGILTQWLGWEYLFGISVLSLLTIPVS